MLVVVLPGWSTDMDMVMVMLVAEEQCSNQRIWVLAPHQHAATVFGVLESSRH